MQQALRNASASTLHARALLLLQQYKGYSLDIPNPKKARSPFTSSVENIPLEGNQIRLGVVSLHRAATIIPINSSFFNHRISFPAVLYREHPSFFPQQKSDHLNVTRTIKKTNIFKHKAEKPPNLSVSKPHTDLIRGSSALLQA